MDSKNHIVYKTRPKNINIYLSPSKEEVTAQIKIKKDLFTSPELESSSESSSISASMSPKKEMQRNVTILDEMGLGTNLASPSYVSSKLQRQSTRKSSIAVSDFWSVQQKEKFLKENGFWEAYQKIQNKSKALSLVYKKSTKQNNLPRIVNTEISKRVNSISQFYLRNGPKKYSNKKFISNKFPHRPGEGTNFKLKALDDILVKCDALSSDTYELKSSTNRFKTSFAKQCSADTNYVNSNKKISRYELKKIEAELNSLS
jgi:hypothetical protein